MIVNYYSSVATIGLSRTVYGKNFGNFEFIYFIQFFGVTFLALYQTDIDIKT